MPTQDDRLSMIIRKSMSSFIFSTKKTFLFNPKYRPHVIIINIKVSYFNYLLFTDKFSSTILYYFTYKTIIFDNSWIIRILYYLEYILLYLYYISHQKTLHHIRFDNFRSRDYTEFRYNSYHINFHTQNRKCQRCTL